MSDILEIDGVSKTYGSGVTALHRVDLNIRRGEIFALLGPNGAGKTTLISIVCALVRASSGHVRVDGHDTVTHWREARRLIGLVPQELTTDAFTAVQDAVAFSRGLFGLPPDPAVVERVLRSLTLWDKRAAKIITLSGGMKRRLLIAKALVHEPRLLFLDEPTAGVDVTLRRDMWALVRQLRDDGVTVVLTTHYIEEAEEMADRVGVINRGRLLLVRDKVALMDEFGGRQLRLSLAQPMSAVPELPGWPMATLSLQDGGRALVYSTGRSGAEPGVPELLMALQRAGIGYEDLQTSQRSLEDIFVQMVDGADGAPAQPHSTAEGARP